MKRIMSLAITLAVAIAYLFVPSVNAGGADPSTTIAGHNLSLEDRINIVYYVTSQDVPTDAEEGILIWVDEPELYAYGTEDYKITTFSKSGQYKLFFFNGLAAKQMTVEVKAMSYIKAGDDLYCSEVDSYSIAEYCNKKLNSTTTGADGVTTLGSVVKTILKYGAASQKYLGYNLDNLAWEGEDYTIDSCEIDDAGHLIVNYSNGSSVDVGKVQGSDGRGIDSLSLDDGNLIVNYSDGTCQQLSLDINGDKFVYQIQDDGSYWVGINRNNSDKVVIVPDTYQNKPITGVIPAGFRFNTFLEEVYLPDSVIELGEYSFADCYYLKKVEGIGVKKVDKFAFLRCYNIQELFSEGEQTWNFGSCDRNGEIGSSLYYEEPDNYKFYFLGFQDYWWIQKTMTISDIISERCWTDYVYAKENSWTENGLQRTRRLYYNGDTWTRN